MDALKIHFAGYNGFGQFKNLQEIVDGFQGDLIHQGSHTSGNRSIFPICFLVETSIAYNAYGAIPSRNIRTYCAWNYLVYSIDNVVYLSGFVSDQIRSVPFECSIRDISCGEKFCLVLLQSGIAYKLNIRTLETVAINPIIISQRNSAIIERKSIFGAAKSGQEFSLNRQNDEIITHIAAGRTLSIALSNIGAVYNIPSKIFTFLSHVKVEKICCGNEHCLILTTNGDVYAFGSSS